MPNPFYIKRTTPTLLEQLPQFADLALRYYGAKQAGQANILKERELEYLYGGGESFGGRTGETPTVMPAGGQTGDNYVELNIRNWIYKDRKLK